MKDKSVDNSAAGGGGGRSPAREAHTFEQKVEILKQIVNNPNHVGGLEAALNEAGIRVSADLVEGVLKKLYRAGAAAQKFFEWAGAQLRTGHSPYAWNLLVDILGKNKLFDAMWDAVKSMRSQGIVSRETFASVFTCYALAEKVNEAIMSFEVMEQYGCPQDVGAFNCLLCALCRYRMTARAVEISLKKKDSFPPEADTYAIILEGWEKEGDLLGARKTFGEMVNRLGWDPRNTAAYNAFLVTLCKQGHLDEAMKFLAFMKTKECFPDKSFYTTAIHALSLQGKTGEAALVFQAMMHAGYLPTTTTYNSMISAYCLAGKMEDAYRLLDGMVFNGAFPDSVTYNTIFQALIKAHKVEEAKSIFREMTKNECDPDTDSYTMAIVLYSYLKDVNMTVTIWKHMTRKGFFPSADCITAFMDSLCDKGRALDAQTFIDQMTEKGIKVPDSTIKRVGKLFSKAQRKDASERLARKRKDYD